MPVWTIRPSPPGLQVLLLYDSDTPALTASEIAKRLGFSISKTYRLIRTMVDFNMLREVPRRQATPSGWLFFVWASWLARIFSSP